MEKKKARISLFPYFPFLVYSIVIAGVIEMALSYLETGHPAIRAMFWPIAGVVFLIFVAVYKFGGRVSPCLICKKPSKDVLIDGNRRRRLFCREHMLEEFKKAFLGFENPIVVFYPLLESKDGPYVYRYEAISDIPRKRKTDSVGRLISEALKSISGQCSRCRRTANVAYFGPGTFQWEIRPTGGVEWDLPKFEDITARPEIVCSTCIVDELTYSLQKFRGDFDEGIVLPYNAEGVFLPMIV
jgi:hypothetical protein